MTQHTILIIDDGEDLYRFCQQFMPSNYRIMHARAGGEGLEILRDRRIDLLILDKSFDRIGRRELLGDDAWNEGLAILKEARQRYPAVPVVMVTAHADTVSRREALWLGAVEYYSWESICTDAKALVAKARVLIRATDV